MLFRDRTFEQEKDLFKLFRFNHPVDFQVFIRIIALIGECFHVSPGKLRPDDSFDGLLGKLDSWTLGEGGERLEGRLEKELSIQLSPNTRVRTIQDIIEYCDNELKTQQTKNH